MVVNLLDLWWRKYLGKQNFDKLDHPILLLSWVILMMYNFKPSYWVATTSTDNINLLNTL